MKSIVTSFLALVLTIGATAQSYIPAVKLTAGKKYEVVTLVDGKMTQDAMGQTMEIPMNISTTSALSIIGASDKGYSTEYVANKVVLSMSAMGQDINYDSDKKEDREGQLGSSINKMIGATTKFTVDAKGNIIKESVVKPVEDKKEDDNSDMMGMMMKNLGLGNAGACPVFDLFTNVTEIKVGDSFVDSTSTKTPDDKTKTSTTYTLKEIKDGIAFFTFTGTIDIEKKVEQMGMEMNVTSNAKVNGDMQIDVATGLLVKKVSVSESTGSVDVQGMSIPTTGKVTSTISVK
ncbi:MAG: hypothetical protein IPP48_13195 [Chitinophagaceae bacterium]|nr:hypothetical protein [Chitinophagaceae bacterium]